MRSFKSFENLPSLPSLECEGRAENGKRWQIRSDADDDGNSAVLYELSRNNYEVVYLPEWVLEGIAEKYLKG